MKQIYFGGFMSDNIPIGQGSGAPAGADATTKVTAPGQPQAPTSTTASILNTLVQQTGAATNTQSFAAGLDSSSEADGSTSLDAESESAFSEIGSVGDQQGGGSGGDGQNNGSGSSEGGYNFSQLASGTGASASQLEAALLKSSYQMAQSAQETEVAAVTDAQAGATAGLNEAVQSADEAVSAAKQTADATIISSSVSAGAAGFSIGENAGAFQSSAAKSNLQQQNANLKGYTNTSKAIEAPVSTPTRSVTEEDGVEMTNRGTTSSSSNSSAASEGSSNNLKLKSSNYDPSKQDAGPLSIKEYTPTQEIVPTPGQYTANDRVELLSTGKVSNDPDGAKTNSIVADLKAGGYNKELGSIKEKASKGATATNQNILTAASQRSVWAGAITSLGNSIGSSVAVPFTLQAAQDTKQSQIDSAEASLFQNVVQTDQSTLGIGTSLMQAAQSFVTSAIQNVMSCFIKNS